MYNLNMPSKNRVKQYTPHTFYHVYNRGIDKQVIFRDEADFTYFLKLMKRYMSPGEKDSQRHGYRTFEKELEILAFCLMKNHVHFLFYVHDDTKTITDYFRSLTNAYVRYFNEKYQRVGHLFQDIFKAVSVDNDPYLLHISRYIHLNPSEFRDYPYSSYQYYLGNKQSDWVKPARILDLYPVASYEDFVTSAREDDEEMGFIEELLAGH